MIPPPITLTTDFGTGDHLVGAMKGVICSILPEARVFDITHDVAAFDVLDAALTVAGHYRYWPADTIHVIVVDPGVGTARRPLLVRAGVHSFIAPDNGVLSLVFDRHADFRAWHINNDRYFIRPVSRTFHGRDIFAPSAAWLAQGRAPETFGTEVSDCERFAFPRPQLSEDAIRGAILRADRFGNLLTNLRPEDAPRLAAGATFRLQIGKAEISRRVATFGEGTPGVPFLLEGSAGFFEVVVNRGSAAQITGAGPGSPFTLEFF